MSKEDVYEVYAIRYATRDVKAYDNFYGHFDPHEDYSMPMDYFIWVAKSAAHTFVIDVGFNEKVSNERKRTFLRCPIETLEKFGVKKEEVSKVIITHMHYDHIGNLTKFPDATFVLQEEEMAFWTGKYASRLAFYSVIEEQDILHLVKENFKAKVKFVNGDEEIAPGINVYKVGGHSAGLQIVTVNTEKGTLVLASDATHYYKNIEEDRPFSGVHNIPQMYDSFDKVNKLASSPELIIPGHDPKVTEKFPSVSDEFAEVVFKLS
ncbi:N-acyl homoserine lactonase family protein [Planococcus salinus]|uniref:N-acyl homoserine lactonase family protein n=1 Tax=Planococcus salinus TaxID=1848460 RepID=A0A3M8P7Z3_9BACL|nr:N-acyl homoserine lactonase family protein [Planococcus salinus]RNF39783.1 N-acyl homoserine lactonase family protein [Planococcus salinus]